MYLCKLLYDKTIIFTMLKRREKAKRIKRITTEYDNNYYFKVYFSAIFLN